MRRRPGSCLGLWPADATYWRTDPSRLPSRPPDLLRLRPAREGVEPLRRRSSVDDLGLSVPGFVARAPELDTPLGASRTTPWAPASTAVSGWTRQPGAASSKAPPGRPSRGRRQARWSSIRLAIVFHGPSPACRARADAGALLVVPERRSKPLRELGLDIGVRDRYISIARWAKFS